MNEEELTEIDNKKNNYTFTDSKKETYTFKLNVPLEIKLPPMKIPQFDFDKTSDPKNNPHFIKIPLMPSDEEKKIFESLYQIYEEMKNKELNNDLKYIKPLDYPPYVYGKPDDKPEICEL